MSTTRPSPDRDARRPEEPAPRGRGPGRWKVALVTLAVAALLGAAVWVVLGSKLLVVRSVEVTGTSLAPRDRVVATAAIRLGLPMARLDTGEVRDRVARLREVESVRVKRRWPATVRIAVRERVPVAVVARSGRYHQFDRHGVAVADSAARPPRLPALVVAAPGPSDRVTLAALGVLHGLPDRLKRQVAEVTADSPATVTLRLAGGPTVVWGGADRTEEKVRLLDGLRRTPAGRTARTIDVSSPEVVTTQ
ncbi:cell division protein FtsQ/DivIB [Actinomadura kijaniata]|uniref:cell division protein FtsQ/DivIB n=1 Tax=Actinomadura kijaniata TaxID=46161 RepID=UPI0031DAA44F